ncbi:hypothetical protein L1887_31707 [Cichorium endivia]|nr:hypothetical protein L1887_31707 [Cichorium endivia]
MVNRIRTYAIILCLIFLTLLVGHDCTRVASKEGNEVGISELRDEKIGWTICNAYNANPGLKWCCSDDPNSKLVPKAMSNSSTSELHTEIAGTEPGTEMTCIELRAYSTLYRRLIRTDSIENACSELQVCTEP